MRRNRRVTFFVRSCYRGWLRPHELVTGAPPDRNIRARGLVNQIRERARVPVLRPLSQAEARAEVMAVDLVWSGASDDLEDRLAIRCRSGDLTAFDELVARYQLRLYRFAYRLLQDRGEAEDAVQESFVRAYRALPAYRPDGFFSSWIYRIALNECRRRMRSRHVTVGLECAPQVAGGPDPQQAVLTYDRHRQLREAVDALPEHYRLVMMFFYFEDMSVEQISRALSVSASAVKVRLHRARARLATRLSGAL